MDGWCEGALGCREMTKEVARQCEKGWNKWKALVVSIKIGRVRPSSLGSCVISDRPPTLWWLHLKRGGMKLHDVVGVNGEKDGTTDIKVQVPSIRAKG